MAEIKVSHCLASIALLGALFLATAANAQGGCVGGPTYYVAHDYNLTPRGPGVDEVHAEWRYNAFARARVDAAEARDKKGPENITLDGAGYQIRTAGVVVVQNTCAVANSDVRVNSLTPQSVTGSLAEFGAVRALVPPGRNASAFASSSGQVGVRGGRRLETGRIEWSSQARFSDRVSGQRGAFTGPDYHDPIVARRTNRTTGETVTQTLLSIEAQPMNGDLTWENGHLQSTSGHFRFKISMESPWTAQTGTLILEVQDGIVTSGLGTGTFASISLPPVGSLGADVAFDLPNTFVIDYDLTGPTGAADGDDIEVQLDMSGGGSGADDDSRLPIFSTSSFAIPEPSSWLTDLGTGADGADVSQTEFPSTIYGYNMNINRFRVADDFTIPPGQTWQLFSVMLPMIDMNSTPNAPLVAASVRIWRGTPGMEGVVIAGDPFTNRLYDSDFANAYRVSTNPLERQAPIKEAWIDLGWVPPLQQGTYWIEIGALGLDPQNGPFVVPTVPRRNGDDARIFNINQQQWIPLIDPTTQQGVALPLQLYGTGYQP